MLKQPATHVNATLPQIVLFEKILENKNLLVPEIIKAIKALEAENCFTLKMPEEDDKSQGAQKQRYLMRLLNALPNFPFNTLEADFFTQLII